MGWESAGEQHIKTASLERKKEKSIKSGFGEWGAIREVSRTKRPKERRLQKSCSFKENIQNAKSESLGMKRDNEQEDGRER